MAERKREGFAPPALGGSSLLVAFAVLALTMFALLSLSTVRADVRLGDAAAEAVKGYYAADCKAQEVLACLRGGKPVPDDVEVNSQDRGFMWTALYSYAVPISDTQELQVEVLVEETYGSYQILRWQSVAVGEWKPDDSLTVWDGNAF